LTFSQIWLNPFIDDRHLGLKKKLLLLLLLLLGRRRRNCGHTSTAMSSRRAAIST